MRHVGDRRSRWPGLVLPLLLVVALPLGRARAAELWIDPLRTPGLLGQAKAKPDVLRRFERVHLVLFADGQTLFKGGTGPFKPPTPDADEQRKGWMDLCRQENVPVFWALDLLRWERTAAQVPSLFQQRPDWLEVDLEGAAWVAPVKYASPFHDEVATTLDALLTEVAALAPQPVGLTLTCRLSSSASSGYSDAARQQYIRERHRDPVDLFTPQERATWDLWREHQLSKFLEARIATYHRVWPSAQMQALVTGDYYLLDLADRSRSADAWLGWLRQGLVSSVIIDGDWSTDRVERIRENLAQIGTGVAPVAGTPGDRLQRSPRPLVHSRDVTGAAVLTPQLVAWAKVPDASRLAVVAVDAPEDWASIAQGVPTSREE